MERFQAIRTVARYELIMQLRRPSLYIGYVLLIPILIAFLGAQFDFLHEHVSGGTYTFTDVLDGWGASLFGILPVAVGLMLADRFQRDRRIKVDELLQTYSDTDSARVIGKWLGGSLAVLLPSFVVFAVGVGVICVRLHDYSGVATAVALFLALGVPVILFVSAYSVICPIVLPVPLYQFLFIGFWGWGVALQPGGPIPTIRGTLLSPDGAFIGLGLFPSWWNNSSVKIYGHVTAIQGVGQMATMLGLAAVALAAGVWVLHRQEWGQ